MQQQQDPLFNPYSPPRTDTNDAVWPEQRDAPLDRPAERGTRLGAAIIDGLLYVATLIPAGVLCFLLRGDEMTPYTIAAVLIVLGILPLAIFQWYRVATTGQSLAKKWLRIRIVKMDGTPVNFVSGVLVRLWVPWLILQAIGFVIGLAGAKDNFTWVFSLIDCLWIFGAGSRCVHDHLAGTKVVVA